MGVSVSVSALIFFISFAICLQMVFVATQDYYEDIRESQDLNAERLDDYLQTSIRVDKVTYNATTKYLTINATNMGSTTLETIYLDVLVNGVIKTSNITSIETGASDRGQWYPVTSITIEVKGIMNPQRVKLSTHNAAASYTTDIKLV